VSDPDVWYVFQQGKTGGFCAPGVVRVKANYPAMGDEYDPSLPEGIIVYIDETSQYPATASKYPLPGRNFKLLTDRDDIAILAAELYTRSTDELIQSDIGHTLDVTIDYCCKEHDGFNPNPKQRVARCTTTTDRGPCTHSLATCCLASSHQTSEPCTTDVRSTSSLSMTAMLAIMHARWWAVVLSQTFIANA